MLHALKMNYDRENAKPTASPKLGKARKQSLSLVSDHLKEFGYVHQSGFQVEVGEHSFIFSAISVFSKTISAENCAICLHSKFTL